MMVGETMMRGGGSSLQASSRSKSSSKLVVGRLVVGPELSKVNNSTSRSESETAVINGVRQVPHSRSLGDPSSISVAEDNTGRTGGAPWSGQPYPHWDSSGYNGSRNLMAPSVGSAGDGEGPVSHRSTIDAMENPPVWEKTWQPPAVPSSSSSDPYQFTRGSSQDPGQQYSLHSQQLSGPSEAAVDGSVHSSSTTYHPDYALMGDQYQQDWQHVNRWQHVNGKYYPENPPEPDMGNSQSHGRHALSSAWPSSSQDVNVGNGEGVYNSGLPLQYDYPPSHSRGAAAGEREDLRSSGSGGLDRSSSETGSGTLSPEILGTEPNVTGNGLVSSSSGGNLSRNDSFEEKFSQSAKVAKEKIEGPGPVRWGAIALEHMDSLVSRSSFDRSDSKPKFRSTPTGLHSKFLATSPTENQAASKPVSSFREANKSTVRRQLSASLVPSSNPKNGPATGLEKIDVSADHSKDVTETPQVKKNSQASPSPSHNAMPPPAQSEEKAIPSPSDAIPSPTPPNLTTSSSDSLPSSQTQPAARTASEALVIDGPKQLPRRNQSDISSLKASIQALQATVSSVAQSVQHVASAQKLKTGSTSVSQELRELRAAVEKLSEGMSNGFTQLAALIRYKDMQQQARLLNLATMDDQDSLVPLPSDIGVVPPDFPAARKDFGDLSPDAVLRLLQHYGLPVDPAHMRVGYLGRFFGLRLS